MSGNLETVIHTHLFLHTNITLWSGYKCVGLKLECVTRGVIWQTTVITQTGRCEYILDQLSGSVQCTQTLLGLFITWMCGENTVSASLHTVPCLISSNGIRAGMMSHLWRVGADVIARLSNRSWASWGSWDRPGWGSWRTRCRRWGFSLLCPLSPQSWVTWPGRGTVCCNPGGPHTPQSHHPEKNTHTRSTSGICSLLSPYLHCRRV